MSIYCLYTKLKDHNIFCKTDKIYLLPETGRTSGGPWSPRTRRGSRRLSRTCPGSSASSWVPTRWAPTGASPAPRSCTPSPSPWRTRLVILVEDKYLNIHYQEPDKLNFLLDIRHIEQIERLSQAQKLYITFDFR